MKKLFGIIFIILMMVIVACSNDDGNSTTENDGSENGNSNNSNDQNNEALTEMQKEIDSFMGEPEFVSPGEPFDAKTEMKGKEIISIPVSSSNPFNLSILENMQDLAEEIGFKVTEWKNQGQPEEWANGIIHGINSNVDLIDLLGGSNPKLLGPQINNAMEKGIKVVTSNGYEETPENVDYNVNVPFYQAGRLLAQWACVNTEGAPKALVITSDEADATEFMVSGIKEEFDKCPSPEVEYVNVPIPDWSSKIQTEVQSALIKNPDIDYILPLYDSMTEYVITGLNLAGKQQGEIKIASFNGTPFVLDYVKNGDVEMVIGEDVEIIARVTLDAEMRVLAGLEPPKDANIPLHIWTSENIDEGIDSSNNKGSFGSKFKEEYEKLWGLTD